MRVLKCGQEVAVLGNGCKGTVLSINIRDTLVTYEVAWFVSDSRHSAWLQESEISIPKGARKMGL